jgi:hypothetical protein
MNKVEAIQALSGWRAAHRRPAWRPRTIACNSDPGLLASKFGEIPWLDADEHWPGCARCWGPLHPVLQLNLSQLPEECRFGLDDGLLQLFGCIRDCRWDQPADVRRSTDLTTLVRRVRPDSRIRSVDPPPEVLNKPIDLITEWELRDDYPRSLEQEELGLKYEYIWGHRAVRVEWQEGGVILEWVEDTEIAEAISSVQDGDKLGGWPAWPRRVAYPDCGRCGRPMRLLFQIDDRHMRLMGDHISHGFIMQCSDHREQVAFIRQA